VATDTRPRLLRATLPAPYNILDLPEGESVEITIDRLELGEMEREIFYRGRRERETRPLLRVHLPVGQFVYGAPYLDIFSQRAIQAIQSVFNNFGRGSRVKLTAVGKEPSKFYSVELLEAGKK
jgi:hypothetical protein